MWLQPCKVIEVKTSEANTYVHCNGTGHYFLYYGENIEDSNGITRSRRSEDRKYNAMTKKKKNNKRINNDLQNSKHKRIAQHKPN
jgi:hypothetical protein